MNMNQIQDEVLYIEDDEINLALMRHIFLKKLPSLKLIEATTARQGIEIAKERKLSLILLDIGLPDQDGFTALKEIKSCTVQEPTPVWAVSASVFESDIKNGLNAGFEKYITKPYDVRKIVKLIKNTVTVGTINTN